MAPDAAVEVLEPGALAGGHVEVLPVEDQELLEVDLAASIGIGGAPELLHARVCEPAGGDLRTLAEEVLELVRLDHAAAVQVELVEVLLVLVHLRVGHGVRPRQLPQGALAGVQGQPLGEAVRGEPDGELAEVDLPPAVLVRRLEGIVHDARGQVVLAVAACHGARELPELRLRQPALIDQAGALARAVGMVLEQPVGAARPFQGEVQHRREARYLLLLAAGGHAGDVVQHRQGLAVHRALELAEPAGARRRERRAELRRLPRPEREPSERVGLMAAEVTDPIGLPREDGVPLLRGPAGRVTRAQFRRGAHAARPAPPRRRPRLGRVQPRPGEPAGGLALRGAEAADPRHVAGALHARQGAGAAALVQARHAHRCRGALAHLRCVPREPVREVVPVRHPGPQRWRAGLGRSAARCR
mmetsp:Transcript_42052/g.118911  ORF Transcript_42052/g.118911 Transcript_42052/m.118911 type:complete len:416 (+) Transcript_42052:359-1606(+)